MCRRGAAQGFKLKKNPNDRDQQHGSDPDRSDLEVGCTVSGEYQSVHCIRPVISVFAFEVIPAIGVVASAQGREPQAGGRYQPR
jgi:hypothetical protein